MIKKSTLIVLLCAIVITSGVYFFQWRKSKQPATSTDNSKPAFMVNASDVVAFSIAHPAQKGQPAIDFEKQKGSWQIVQPIDTLADQSTAEGFVDQLAESRPTGAEPVTPDRRKAL